MVRGGWKKRILICGPCQRPRFPCCPSPSFLRCYEAVSSPFYGCGYGAKEGQGNLLAASSRTGIGSYVPQSHASGCLFFLLPSPLPPSLPQIPLDSWLSHCFQEPGTASEGDRHSLTMADHSCDKFRVNQGCSCSRWEQGSDLAAVVLQLEKERPQRFVCEDGSLKAPGTANQKAAVTGEGSRQAPQAGSQPLLSTHCWTGTGVSSAKGSAPCVCQQPIPEPLRAHSGWGNGQGATEGPGGQAQPIAGLLCYSEQVGPGQQGSRTG